MSIHREENVDYKNNFDELLNSINEIEKVFSANYYIYSSKNRKKLNDINHKNISDKITFADRHGFFDYVKLQMNAFCTISDSGTITEEASILNFPAITIRQAQRPEGMDEGTIIMSQGLDKERIIESIKVVSEIRLANIVNDYNVDNVLAKYLK